MQSQIPGQTNTIETLSSTQPRPAARPRAPLPTLADLVGPRWIKVLRDLWSNRMRTLLVVLSIFVGVFAVGMIAGSQIVISHDLRATYQQAKPAHITISSGVLAYNTDFSLSTADASKLGFSADLVQAIEHMPAVALADGRRVFNAQAETQEQGWAKIQFIAIDDYDEVRVNQFRTLRGATEPPDHGVLIERTSLALLGKEVGDTVRIELPGGKERVLHIAGVVHDMHQWPTPLIGTIYAYCNLDTAEWLGEPREFNQVVMRVAEQGHDKAHNEAVAEEVYDKVQRAGLDPSFPQVAEPGEHPLEFLITSITALMSVMSVLAILLSGFLVANTIGAILAQQIRQIGIMKAVGARSSQVIGMYLLLVLCFGLLALLPAVPLAQFAMQEFVGLIATLVNFDVQDIRIPLLALALQVAMSILVPLVAALWPTISGAQVTVREALDSVGVSATYGTSRVDRLLRRVRGLPPSLLLSLRNTFRRKLRLISTVATLTLAGAIFISVFSVRNSLWQTNEDLTRALYNYDVHIFLERSYRTTHIATEAQRIPGVHAAEGQVQTNVRRVFADDTQGASITLIAVPPDTETMAPQIMRGRWLLPTDENAMVVSTGLLNKNPDLDVGSTFTLEIEEKETRWQIVGVMPAMGRATWGYVNYDYYGRLTDEVDQSSYIRVVAEGETLAEQKAIATALEEHFQRQGINVLYTESIEQLREQDREVIGVMVASLLAMAVLVALVGGLGLAGAMSLGVIERVREIGVMRAIGGSDRMILQVVMGEGMLIGVLAWALGALVAVPASKLMSDGMGMLLFSMPLSFNFSLVGVLIWLGLSLAVAAVASYLPARSATRVSVREVLAHE